MHLASLAATSSCCFPAAHRVCWPPCKHKDNAVQHDKGYNRSTAWAIAVEGEVYHPIPRIWQPISRQISKPRSVPVQPLRTGQQTDSHNEQQARHLPAGTLLGQASSPFQYAPGCSPHNNMHPAVVMQRLKSTRSMYGLSSAWDACQHAVTIVHLTAALLHLAKLSEGLSTQSSTKARSAAQQLLQAIMQRLQPQISSLDGCGLVNTLQALAMLHHHDHQLIHELVSLSLPLLPSCTPAQLATMIKSLAQLQFQPPAAWRQAFYSATLHQLSNLPEQDGPCQDKQGQRKQQQQQLQVLKKKKHHGSADERNRCVVGCLSGLQQLGCRPPTAWITAMLGCMQLQHADAVQLSGVMHTLACLRYVPPGAFTTALMQVSEQQLRKQMSSSMQQGQQEGQEQAHTGGVSGAHGAAAWGHANAATGELDKPTQPMQGLQDLHLQQQQRQQQPDSCTWQFGNLVQLLRGLSQLGLPVPLMFRHLLCSVMLKCVHAAQPREQVMLLQAVSHMRLPAGSQGTSQPQQARAAKQKQLSAYSRKQAASVQPPVIAFSAATNTKEHQKRQQLMQSRQPEQQQQPYCKDVQLQHGDQIVQQLHDMQRRVVRCTLNKALESVHELSIREVVLMMLYCSRMHMGLHPFWLRTILRSVVLPNMHTASPVDMALTAYSLTRLRCKVAAKVPNAILQASQSRLSMFSPQELGNLCWGLSGMRAAPSNKWLVELGEAIIDAGPRLQPREVHQLATALPRLACRPARLRALAAQFWQLQGAVSLLHQKCEDDKVAAMLHTVLSTGSVNLGELQAYATVPRHTARKYEGLLARRWRKSLRQLRAGLKLGLGRGRTSREAAALGRNWLQRSLQAMQDVE